MSQTIRILSHLKRRPITPLQALDLYGCMRLAARVADLRERGHKIITEPLELNGKRFAKYRLIEVEGAKNPPKRV